MEPVKIGWLGSALDGPGGGYDKIHHMAFDEAAEQALLDRPVEFVIHPENGLPQGSAKNALDGFRGDWLLYGRVRDGKLEFEGLFEPWD